MGNDGKRGDGTPVPGAPVAPLEDQDTGRLSAQLHGQATLAAGAMSPASPPAGTLSPEAFLDALSAKVAAKVNGQGGHGNGGTRRFLGLDRGSWTKMVLGWALAGLLAIGAWYLAVRDALHERPTAPQVGETIREGFAVHDDSSAAHPPIQRRLDSLTAEQRIIRDSQIEQATTDKQQTKLLEKIERKIDRRNR